MKITPRTWLILTTGERMSILRNAVERNCIRWEKKKPPDRADTMINVLFYHTTDEAGREVF